MNWLLLIIAGLFEIAFTTCLGKTKVTTGYEYYAWFTGFLICLFVSMYLLLQAIKTIPMGTAYAVWTGIGATGSMLIGVFFFKEPSDFWRMFFVSTLIISIVGLKIVSK